MLDDFGIFKVGIEEKLDMNPEGLLAKSHNFLVISLLNTVSPPEKSTSFPYIEKIIEVIFALFLVYIPYLRYTINGRS